MKNVCVMEFGSSKITAIIGSSGVNNTFNIRGYGSCDYAGYECEEKAEFFEPSRVSVAAKHALSLAEENAAESLDTLYVGVPAAFSRIIVKSAALSLNKKRKITAQDISDLISQGSAALGSEQVGRSIISCVPVHFVLDDNRKVSKALGLSSNRLSASISYVLADNTFTHFISAMARDLGISRVEFVSSVMAEYLYLFDEEQREGYCVLVDIGLIASSVALCKDESVVGLSTFEMGGGHLTGMFMEEFSMDFAPAELLKRKVVLTLDAQKGDLYSFTYKAEKLEFCAATAGELASLCAYGMAETIKDAINNFEIELPDYTTVYVTGGGLCYMRGAREALSKGIGRRVEFVKPSVPMLNKPELSSELGVLSAAIKDNETSEKVSLLNKFTNFLRR